MNAILLSILLALPAGDGQTAQWEPLDTFGNLVADGDWSNVALWDQLALPDTGQVAVIGFTGLGDYVCRIDDVNPTISGVLVNSAEATMTIAGRTVTVLDDPFDLNGLFAIAAGRVNLTQGSIVVASDVNGGGFLQNQGLLVPSRGAILDVGHLLNQGTLRVVTGSGGAATVEIIGDVMNVGLLELDSVTGQPTTLEMTGGMVTNALGIGTIVFRAGAGGERRFDGDLLNIGMVVIEPEAIVRCERLGSVFGNAGNSLGIELGTNADWWITNGTLDNTVGSGNASVTLAAGSEILLDEATIVGGIFRGGGRISPAPGNTVGYLDGSTVPGGIRLDGARLNLAFQDQAILRGTLTNDGLVTLDDVGNGMARLTIDGEALIDGTGDVEFRSPNDNRIDRLVPTDRLTIGPGQRLITVEPEDHGEIRVDCIHRGVIESIGLIDIATASFVNEGELLVHDGGAIALTGVACDNTRGTITIEGAGSRLWPDASTIVGGTIRGDGAGVLSPPAGNTTCTLEGVHLEGAVVSINAGDEVVLRGSIVNDGAIRCNDAGTGVALLTIDGNVAILGAGAVQVLTANTNRLGGVGPDDALTLGAGQRLEVPGTLDANVALHVAGTVAGAGTIDMGSDLLSVTGTIAPGDSIGRLDVIGDVALAPSSTLSIEVADGAGDRLAATGTVTLDGMVQVAIEPGYAPVGGEQWVIVTAGALRGAFTVIDGPGAWSIDADGGAVTITLVTPPLPGDVDDDGTVGFADLLAVLQAWGPCPMPCPPACTGDLDGDCLVGFSDLLLVLQNWS